MNGPWGDIDDYMESAGARTSRGYNGINRVMECPWCGAEDRLYVLVDSTDPDERPNGSYICYKCRMSGRSFWRLYAALEGVDVAEARAQHISDGAHRRKVGWAKDDPARRAVYAVSGSVTASGAELGAAGGDGGREQLALPREFIPVWDGRTLRLPQYLADRGVDGALAARYGLGYCERGAYANRIVFPLVDPHMPAHRGFTTRAIRNEGHDRRWISSVGASRMVFGWDQAMAAPDVGVVEGGFDVLGCARAGLTAIGVSGKGVPADVIALLYAGGCETVWLGLDPDAVFEAIQGGLLAPQSERLRMIKDLPEGRDPGDAPTDVLLAAWRASVPLEVAWSRWMRGKLFSVGQRLGGLDG